MEIISNIFYHGIGQILLEYQNELNNTLNFNKKI